MKRLLQIRACYKAESKGREDEIISSRKAYQSHCYVCSGVQACHDTQSVFCPGRAAITEPRRRLPQLPVKKSPHSFPRRRMELEGRQTPTNRDSSVFRHWLDVYLQTGGLDRYRMHDPHHVPRRFKAWNPAPTASPPGPFNSLRPLWQSAQARSSSPESPEKTTPTVITLTRPAVEPDGRAREPVALTVQTKHLLNFTSQCFYRSSM